MGYFDIVIATILSIGLLIILFIVGKALIYKKRKTLREIKATLDGPTNPFLTIVLFTPIYLIGKLFDRIFDLKIFVDNFEQASKRIRIDSKHFSKTIFIKTIDNSYRDKVKSLIDNEVYKLNARLVLSPKNHSFTERHHGFFVYFSFEQDFISICRLVQFLSLRNNKYKIIDVLGIMISKYNKRERLFCYYDVNYPNKVVGRYKNRKMYVDLNNDSDIVCLNQDLEEIKRININKMIN